MQIVISYAREDRAVVGELVETLQALGHQAWTDAGAHAGAHWWDEILQRIRECEVLLAVTSPASLASRACTLERQYALALNRRLLPVTVVPIDMHGLPSDFAQVHFFDFTVRNVAAAGRLHQALTQIPPAPPLPQPLPSPPPPPLSYLNTVADQIAALPHDMDAQHRIVTALVTGLHSDDSLERDTARDLMRRYLNHPQRLHDPAGRAGQALATIEGARAAYPVPPQHAVPPPPRKRSGAVTALAWIGGLAVAVVVLGIWAASWGGDGGEGNRSGGTPAGGNGTGTAVGGLVAPAVVSQAVYNDLVGKGMAPTSVSCNALSAQVGASTVCATPGLLYPTTTVTVNQVSGPNVVAWSYTWSG